MMRLLTLTFVVGFAAAISAEEELPKADPNEPMDIEPPLLIQEAPNQNVVYTTPATQEQKPPGDPERIAVALEKAKKSAASGERLYKGGIIAKVDAENRALKVVRLEAELAAAKLELAKQALAAEELRFAAGEIAESELEPSRASLTSATKDAEAAMAKKEQAELDAAVINLRRQQKLLALGSGRKSAVNRAQEKVESLQQKN